MASTAAGDVQRGLMQALRDMIASSPQNVRTCAQQVLDIRHVSDSPAHGLILRRPHAFLDYVKTQMQFAGVPGLELSGQDWFQEVEEIRALVKVHLQRVGLLDEPVYIHLLARGPLYAQFALALLARIRSQDPDLSSAAARDMSAFVPFARSLLEGALHAGPETREARRLRHGVLRFVVDRARHVAFDRDVLDALAREPAAAATAATAAAAAAPVALPPPDFATDGPAAVLWRQMELGAQDTAHLVLERVRSHGGPGLLGAVAAYPHGFLLYARLFWEDDEQFSRAPGPGPAAAASAGFHASVESFLRAHHAFLSRGCDGLSWYYELVEERDGAAAANRRAFEEYQDEVSRDPEGDELLNDADLLAAMPLGADETGGAFPGFTGAPQASGSSPSSSSSSEGSGALDFDRYCVFCSHRLLVDERDQVSARAANREPPVTLACGHVVGAVCFRAREEVYCPFCRH